jgi:hypothetical protein
MNLYYIHYEIPTELYFIFIEPLYNPGDEDGRKKSPNSVEREANEYHSSRSFV